jgi:branched-chain amino acid transport system ATP-binding protein
VARTFQNIRLFGGLTVLENLMVAQHNSLMIASGFSIFGILGLPNFKKAERAAVEKGRAWLEEIGLVGRADDPAADLPYGAQRRLEIARAMCTGPELLCLDEPAAGLNPRESAELNQLLLRIRDKYHTSVLLIEHDMSVVMEISDHVVVLEYGIKIADDTSEAIRRDPKVIAAYLGVDDTEVEKVEEDLAALEASCCRRTERHRFSRCGACRPSTARSSHCAASTSMSSTTKSLRLSGRTARANPR